MRDKIVIVALSYSDPITEHTELRKKRNFWTFGIDESFNDLAKKTLKKIPEEFLEDVETVIFSTLNNDETARAKIYDDVSLGKDRSKPSTVLAASSIGIRVSLCEMLKTNPDIFNVQSACSTGLKSLEVGVMTAILKDQVVLVGACDKMATDYNLVFFNSLGALSKSDAYIGPFDKNRSGFAMGEGAAFMVICKESFAVKKGWQPVAYIDSVVSAAKAVHPTDPSDLQFISDLTEKCIKDSGKSKKEFAHWNAHATCTPSGDLVEYLTFASVFKNIDIPISSLKGNIGHTMGPAGLIEVARGIESIKKNEIFFNERLYDPLENDDRILKTTQKTDKKTFLKCSFGFGGRNSIAVITAI
jgi:3-oxoacyl-[acyl-carrier-protein] synthase II